MEITVIGSCICRDLFNLDKSGKYTFKTDVRFMSPFSMNSDFALDKQVENSSFCNDAKTYNSQWFRNNLMFDFNKNLFDHLKNNHGKFCVIDLADARIPLLELEVNKKITYFSKSVPFDLHYEASLKNTCFKNAKFKKINPRDISIEKWKACIKKYLLKLISIFGKDNIILIQNYCLKNYIDKDDKISSYKDYNLNDFILTSSSIFESLYSYAETFLNPNRIIKIPPFSISDSKNVWGQHPLHMTTIYYHYLLECIDSICFENSYPLEFIYDKYSEIFKIIFCKHSIYTGLMKADKENMYSYFPGLSELTNDNKQKFFAVAKVINDAKINKISHYGINNLYINRAFSYFIENFGKSLWTYPSLCKDGALVISDLNLGKGISFEELAKLLEDSKNQLYIFVNKDVIKKLNQILKRKMLLIECTLFNKFIIGVFSNNQEFYRNIKSAECFLIDANETFCFKKLDHE